MVNMTIFGYTFFGHNSGDHYLSIGDEKSSCQFLIWGNFGGNGRGHHSAPNGVGPPNPTNTLAHWVDVSGQPLSRKHAFEIFWDELPPSPLKFLDLVHYISWVGLFLSSR